MAGAEKPIPMAGKAATLEALTPYVKSAEILPLLRFSVSDWQTDASAIMDRLGALPWGGYPLIVRSSAGNEDGACGSNAGRYKSIKNVLRADLPEAVAEVIASYGIPEYEPPAAGSEVLIQPLLTAVRLSGVAFSHDPNTGAPYVIINYDEGADASSVTGGHGQSLKTLVISDGADPVRQPLERVRTLVGEVARLTGGGPVDIEFALTHEGHEGDDGQGDGGGRLFLLQARPLVLRVGKGLDPAPQRRSLAAIAASVSVATRPHPYLHGRRTVFGIMPDWNPAEIIGTRPRPLALSLYREIITDSIWAYQRHNYGYRNLRSFPLLVSFCGLPYIDVRVSFNSFIPADIEPSLAERLVNFYIDSLIAAPHLHDKVEFEIVHSCYTFDIADRMATLQSRGFPREDVGALTDSLRRLTNHVIDRDQGLCRRDLDRIETLVHRRQTIMASDLDDVARIYWLLEDCKRYGTLPFAGLARGGFIAVQMLASLVSIGVLSPEAQQEFIAGLDTVSARLGRDLQSLDRERFLARYGHLRPGTYDILSPRYDEAPDLYFPAAFPAGGSDAPPSSAPPFQLSLAQLRQIGGLLQDHGLKGDVVALFDFLETGIRGREYAKFVFTQSLSDALAVLGRLGQRFGFSLDDLSYLDIRCLYDIHTGNLDIAEAMARSIQQGREMYEGSQALLLPPLITGPEDVWAFELTSDQPNFITRSRVSGHLVTIDQPDRMPGGIVMIPSADPGFDWIFHRGIRGFITTYGGVNSHMAIRAGELGIPAVIGAGEVLFRRWSTASVLEIDAANRQVHVIR